MIQEQSKLMKLAALKNNRPHSLYYIFNTIILLCSVSWGQTQELELSIRKTIQLALKNNPALQASQYNVEISEANIGRAKASLTPQTKVAFNRNASQPHPAIDSGIPKSLEEFNKLNDKEFDLSNFKIPRVDPSSGKIAPFYPFEELEPDPLRERPTNQTELRFSDRFKTGTNYTLSMQNRKFFLSYPKDPVAYLNQSNLSLTLSQPLLKGFGITANTADLQIAQNLKVIEEYRFRRHVESFVAEAQRLYWEFVFATENLKVKEISLQQANQLLEINQRRRDVGMATLSDILQARAAIAAQEAQMIVAQDQVNDRSDELKRITNIMTDENAWSIQIIPTDKPSTEFVDLDLDESLKTSLENRAEYIGNKIDLENKNIQFRLAENQRLPELDMEGTFALRRVGETFGDTLSSGARSIRNWQVGMFITYPIGDPAGKSFLRRAQLEKAQAIASFKDQELQITIEVREAVRQLETSQKQIVATQFALDLEERKLAAEEKRYQVGLSTSFNLLRFQTDLSEARSRHLRAIIGYNQAFVLYTKALGTTLQEHNVQLAADGKLIE